MKSTILAAALLVAAASAAEAKCGTNQLNGDWRFQANLENLFNITITNGTISGLPDAATISQTEKCKVTIVVDGFVYIGSSEALSKSTKVRPRRIYAGIPDPSEAWIIMHRR